MVSGEVQKAKPEFAGLLVSDTGLQLRNVDDMWRFAQYIVKSEMVPKGIKTAEQVVVAMQYGLELGFSPMRALHSVAVIHGKPSLMMSPAMGLLRSHRLIEQGDPRREYKGEKLARSCRVWIEKNPLICGEFSMAEAEKAGLLAKAKGQYGDGPWLTYPDRMLYARALGRMVTDYFSEVLLGLPIAEAVQAGTSEEIDVTSVARVVVPEPGAPDPLLDSGEPPADVDSETGEVQPALF